MLTWRKYRIRTTIRQQWRQRIKDTHYSWVLFATSSSFRARVVKWKSAEVKRQKNIYWRWPWKDCADIRMMIVVCLQSPRCTFRFGVAADAMLCAAWNYLFNLLSVGPGHCVDAGWRIGGGAQLWCHWRGNSNDRRNVRESREIATDIPQECWSLKFAIRYHWASLTDWSINPSLNHNVEGSIVRSIVRFFRVYATGVVSCGMIWLAYATLGSHTVSLGSASSASA